MGGPRSPLDELDDYGVDAGRERDQDEVAAAAKPFKEASNGRQRERPDGAFGGAFVVFGEICFTSGSITAGDISGFSIIAPAGAEIIDSTKDATRN